MNYKQKEILIHSLTWIIMILCFLFMGSSGLKIKYELVVLFVYFGILNIAVFYANYSYLLPNFLARKRYRDFILSAILLIVVAGFVKYGLAYLNKEYVLMSDAKKQLSFATYFVHTLLVSTFFIFLSSAVHFTVDWFKNEQARKNFETEKLTAELSFLKSQINPHFLLNSLNNIYSLAYQRSDKTPEAVLKLSEIMKYMLYESNDMKVAISKEVHYLENYIELQKIRMKDSAFVEMGVTGTETGQLIVPLVLIPFIENAFKHGVIHDPAAPVKIHIAVSPGKLVIRVSNKKNKHNKDETGGIGLHNVRRRLALLYPGKHTLAINEDADLYTCELSLDL